MDAASSDTGLPAEIGSDTYVCETCVALSEGAQRVTTLEAARALGERKPESETATYNDGDGWEWWEEHAALFAEAQMEWGARCPEIYHLMPMASNLSSSKITAEISNRDVMAGTARWLQAEVRAALSDGSPKALRSVLREVCRDSIGYAVYAFNLFTDEFCEVLLSELDHLEASGIPLRRPNGMNRFGAILSSLGFHELVEPLTKYVMKPLAQELWPEWVGEHDCDETYGFVVRYRMGEDLALAEHADTSNVTLNACLGRDFSGGELYFKGVRFTNSADDTTQHLVAHHRGVALIHLGGHFHAATPIASGERHNLILWGQAPHGKVRVLPINRPNM